MDYPFFATVSRMKYIERWALMRNSRAENLSEHSLEVAMLSHALCTLGNVRLGKQLNAEKAALIGLYHDAAEIITGDLPTPVKYGSESLRKAYRTVESVAEEQLLRKLPEDLQPVYRDIFCGTEEEAYLRRLVKAADKLSAYIKCIEEEESGNREFRSAKESTWEALFAMQKELPELAMFIEDFLGAYGRTLDELTTAEPGAETADWRREENHAS